MVQEYLQTIILRHKLPPEFVQTVDRWYQPLAADLAQICSESPSISLIAVQGTQGSGKSTLADFVREILWHQYKLRAVVLSLDDFYLTRTERSALAQEIHPLLATRGVPGTHDVDLALQIINRLKNLKSGEELTVPRFDKAVDDRKPASQWESVAGPVDLIIFEGWCLGATPQSQIELQKPLNDLESNEDPDLIWRTYVNDQLSGPYRTLFSQFDKLIVLAAPSFDCVYQWRLLQEQKLAQSWSKQHSDQNNKIQSPEQLRRFISHYQRLTSHCLRCLPQHADWLLRLNHKHEIIELKQKQAPPFVIATDLDGTLLDHYTYSWTKAATAVDELKSRNIPIIVNTSKTYNEIVEIQHDLDICNPFIVENGSAVYLPMDNTHDGIDDLEIHDNFLLKVLGQYRSKIVEQLYKLRTQYRWQFEGYSDWSVDKLMELTGLARESALASMDRQFSEPIIWQDSDNNLLQFRVQLNKLNLKLLRGGRFFHVLGVTDKGTALSWLMNYYQKTNLSRPKIIALGDSQNDVDMLGVADIAVLVKSPVHSFPELAFTGKKIYTDLFGPSGWNDAILTIINDTTKVLSGEQHG